MVFIYGDESGWTGPDLTDEAQPVLAVSTLGLTPAEAAKIHSRFFGPIRAAETKFGDLRSLPEGQAAVLGFLKLLADSPMLQKSFIVHKQYALVGKIVDILVETAAYATDHDLYANGAHIDLMKALHWGLPRLLGGHWYRDFLSRWQDLARKPTPERIKHFHSLVSGLAYPPRVEKLLAPLRFSERILRPDVMIKLLRRSELDVLGTSLWSLCFSWNRERGKAPIRVLYDEQSKLQADRKAWSVLTSPDFKPPPGMVARLPVVDQFEFGQSTKNRGIQLADVLSGSIQAACRYWLARQQHEAPTAPQHPFLDALFEHVGKLRVDSIWPGDLHSPENALVDYAHAQELIDASTAVQEKANKKKS